MDLGSYRLRRAYGSSHVLTWTLDGVVKDPYGSHRRHDHGRWTGSSRWGRRDPQVTCTDVGTCSEGRPERGLLVVVPLPPSSPSDPTSKGDNGRDTEWHPTEVGDWLPVSNPVLRGRCLGEVGVQTHSWGKGGVQIPTTIGKTLIGLPRDVTRRKREMETFFNEVITRSPID